MHNQKIYEINTRVWLKRFNKGEKKAALKDVPKSYWEKLKQLGIDYVWLMGIWQTCSSTVKKYCFEDYLIDEYKRALPDWTEEDVIGSPYAIDKYEINPLIGTTKELVDLRKKLNSIGLKLILDFVPNHFNVESNYVKTNPEYFIQVSEQEYDKDTDTFFADSEGRNIFFAHGRDPNFPSWKDTIQLNYFSTQTRKFMTDNLLTVAGLCDGVRCDMAILILNGIFEKTWGAAVDREKRTPGDDEFWLTAISEVKKKHPEFVLIAEAYWNLEWTLQQLGFDYTYDKRLTDRLKHENAQTIRAHLLADETFQKKSVRFIENHDEERAVTALGYEKSKAAAVIISTLYGMSFYYDGQFEECTVKLPVQLGREPIHESNAELYEFYVRLLKITSDAIFRKGDWKLLEAQSSGGGDNTYENILIWQWTFAGNNKLVAVNYSEHLSTCRVKFEAQSDETMLHLSDVLNNDEYDRTIEEINNEGLFIMLGGYQSHIFAF